MQSLTDPILGFTFDPSQSHSFSKAINASTLKAKCPLLSFIDDDSIVFSVTVTSGWRTSDFIVYTITHDYDINRDVYVNYTVKVIYSITNSRFYFDAWNDESCYTLKFKKGERRTVATDKASAISLTRL